MQKVSSPLMLQVVMCSLMANVLKDEGNLWKINLCSKKVIMIAFQLCVRKMIPTRDDFS